MRRLGLGGDEKAAGVLVEAMHDAGAHPADPGEARAAMREQRVDQRPRRVAGRRMHDHAGRLVDDDQVRILVHDSQRDGLTRESDRRSLGDNDGENLARFDPP